MSYETWTALDPAEVVVLTLDMTDAVAGQGGNPIVSATAAVSLLIGNDPNPQALLQGSCNVSASPKVMVQKAPVSVPNNTYLVTITALTSAGAVLVGSAILPIQAGGA